MEVDFAVVRDLIRTSPNELTVEIPSSNGKNHMLELTRSYPLSEDFKLTSKAEAQLTLTSKTDFTSPAR